MILSSLNLIVPDGAIPRTSLKPLSSMPPVLDNKLHWYKDAIIYELHIKAFHDSNSDGIGDFEGLLEKLDYLEDLGVTAIWLLPFYPSPQKDDGYDIADYYRINGAYGNIQDFRRLLKEAHKRNLKVITELVINHTSDQHPWFQRARNAPRGSEWRNYYVWTDDPNQYKDVRIIFQDFEASNWTWDAVAQQYYWHRFFHHQPDLNYDSDAVQDEVFKIIDYWCRLGVDGFRLDAVPYLFEREGTNGENLPETHEFLKKLRRYVDEKHPGTVFLAEANMWPEDAAAYFGNGDECQMNYHFPVMPRIFMALQMEGRYPITDIFDQTPEIPETCQWAIFLRNHDELTLEMVTDEERDYMYKVYAKDPKAKINLGIRHRLAPLMENNRRKIELLNCLLFSLRGTPVIYYGDEIGMGDNVYLGDRNGVRTPMQWSPDRNAGFSQCNPQKLYLPVILDPEYHFEAVNVETQYRNPSSLLWFMKRMISMRKKYGSFSRGDMKFINIDNPKVLAFTRTYEDEIILVIVNLSRYSQAAELDLSEYKGYYPLEIFSKNRFPPIREDSLYFFTLDSYSYHWFLLQKLHPEVDESSSLPALRVDTWKDVVSNDVLEELSNNVLPDYLVKASWFDEKFRNVQRVAVTRYAALPVQGYSMFSLLVEISFKNDLPELYHLPVAVLQATEAKKMMETDPQAPLCILQTRDEEAYLCDAIYVNAYRQFIFSRMASGQDIQFRKDEIWFSESKRLKKHLAAHPESKSKIISEQNSHTSITYDNAFFLKLYRKVDLHTNPDLEITKYFSTQGKFKKFPLYLGSCEWKISDTPVSLGMMQVMVENHGDGRSYMLDRIDDFAEKVLTSEKDHPAGLEPEGSLLEPLEYENLPHHLQGLLDAQVAEAARLLGVCTGEMHLELASEDMNKDFTPENFSLHYQRSLYSGFQSLVREAFSGQSANLQRLPEEVRKETEEVFDRKDKVLKMLKRIYSKKFNVTKIRIHGNFYLEQVLYTGKDVSVIHFGGNAERTFSERRIKRSPLRDVVGIVRSFHYVAHEYMLSDHVRKEDIPRLEPYMRLWVHHVCRFFMHAYLQTVEGSSFIPKEKNDLEVLFQIYLLEKALISLQYELKMRPEWAIVPVKLIRTIVD